MKKVYKVISDGFIMNMGFSDEFKLLLKYGDVIHTDDDNDDSQVCLHGMYNDGKWIDLRNTANFVHFYKKDVIPDTNYGVLFIKDCLNANILEDITIKTNRENKLKELGI